MRKKCGLKIIDSVEKEFGYIRPSGGIDYFDWRNGCHSLWAKRYLIDNEFDRIAKSGDTDLIIGAYLHLTGDVRLSIWQKGVNVSFHRLTYQQLSTIKQKVKENVTIESGRFDFDILNSCGHTISHGNDIRQLKPAVCYWSSLKDAGG